MIASPYDLDSRYSEKRSQYWRGYKVHLTETCDDDTPNVIPHVKTTMATEQDVTVVETIHQALKQHDRRPGSMWSLGPIPLAKSSRAVRASTRLIC